MRFAFPHGLQNRKYIDTFESDYLLGGFYGKNRLGFLSERSPRYGLAEQAYIKSIERLRTGYDGENRRQLLGIFIGICTGGIIIVGYFFNAFQSLLI